MGLGWIGWDGIGWDGLRWDEVRWWGTVVLAVCVGSDWRAWDGARWWGMAVVVLGGIGLDMIQCLWGALAVVLAIPMKERTLLRADSGESIRASALKHKQSRLDAY